MKKESPEERWDVLIVEWKRSGVVSIAGTAMRANGEHNSAERRMDTVMMRCNDSYGPVTVPRENTGLATSSNA